MNIHDRSNQDLAALGRRGLLIGGGALVGLLAAGEQPAGASLLNARRTMGVAAEPFASPVATSIASAPTSGFVYRIAGMYDFFPFDPGGVKTWGGLGVYSAAVSTPLRACIDIPPGATVGDVEYYVYNNSTNTATGSTFLYVPGQGTISSISADVSIPGGSSAIVAYRAVPTSDGPYPLGAKLYVSISTPTDGTVQINGARVGFQLGGGQIGMQPKQVRVYDSQTAGGKFGAGETRSIILPSSYLAPGATAVILDVTTTAGAAVGNLKVFSSASAPASPNVYYDSTITSAAEITVPINTARKLKILTSHAVHVALDIVGTIG